MSEPCLYSQFCLPLVPDASNLGVPSRLRFDSEPFQPYAESPDAPTTNESSLEIQPNLPPLWAIDEKLISIANRSDPVFFALLALLTRISGGESPCEWHSYYWKALQMQRELISKNMEPEEKQAAMATSLLLSTSAV